MLSILLTHKGGGIPEAIDNKAFFNAIARQRVNKNDNLIVINDKQYDYSTLTINGVLAPGILRIVGVINASGNPLYPAAKQGDAWYITVGGAMGGAGGMSVHAGDFVYALADNPGGSQTSVGMDWTVSNVNLSTEINALYVDAVFGNDATAVKNSLANKYKTIASAQAAAIAGDTIVVFPGIYTEDIVLGANGLTYSFPYGATVNGVWSDGAGGSNFRVAGCADMVSTSTVLNVANGSNVYFQCKSMTCSGTAGQPAIFAGGGSQVTVEVSGDIQSTISDTIQSAGTNTALCVYANRLLSAARACVVLAGNTPGHKQYIYAKEVIVNGAGAALSWSNGGYQEMHLGRCLRSAGSLIGGIILYQDLFVSFPSVRIFADFNDSSSVLAVDLNNNGGRLEYIGDIVTNGQIGVSGGSAIFSMKGDITATPNDDAAVDVRAGTVELKGRVTNLANTANAHGIRKEGGILILNGTVIVTANAATVSVFAEIAQNVVAYAAFSNHDKSAAVTIQAGALTFDVNVQ